MGTETPDRGGGEAPPRPPTLKDLALLCAELNRLRARYVVVGGLAMLQAGLFRTTEDIDLLIEAQGLQVEPTDQPPAADPLTRWWRRLKARWAGRRERS